MKLPCGWCYGGLSPLVTAKCEHCKGTGVLENGGYLERKKMRNKTFDTLMDSLKELHDKKNEDYAEENNPYSNFEFAAFIAQQFDSSVDQAFATLIGIKLARLGQLKNTGKEPNHESIEDTMKDLTNYCAIWTSRTIDQAVPDRPNRLDIDKKEVDAIKKQTSYPEQSIITDIEVPKGY